MKEIEPKKLFGLLDHFLGAIKTLRVHLEDSGRIDCEGTVNVDRYRGNCALLGERVEHIDHLLSATKCKRRDQDSPTLGCGFADYLGKLSSGSFYGLMLPVSVGGLHDQRVGAFGRNRISDDCEAAATNVSREYKSLSLPSLGTIEQNRG